MRIYSGLNPHHADTSFDLISFHNLKNPGIARPALIYQSESEAYVQCCP